jgi:mono/diheme cytochrome c family protein
VRSADRVVGIWRRDLLSHWAPGQGEVEAVVAWLRRNVVETDYLIDVLLGGQHAMPALGRAMSDAQPADLVNYVSRVFADARNDPATSERAAAARATFKR